MANSKMLHAFYKSDTWRNFRKQLIIVRGNRCEECGEVIKVASNIELDHIIELTEDNYKDVNIALNPDNIKIKCTACHNRRHKRFESNYLHSRKVYIVYGAPLSGKKSYVRQHMKRGDLVVDIDLIYRAISGTDLYDKPSELYNNVNAIRNTLIDNIKTRYGKWRDAYIIGGFPLKGERERLKQSLGAELIFCDSTKDECIGRLYSSDRVNMADEWIGYIDKWFEQYQG